MPAARGKRSTRPSAGTRKQHSRLSSPLTDTDDESTRPVKRPRQSASKGADISVTCESRSSPVIASAEAREVYNATEIIERIYAFCDNPTLARCLLLEKSATAPVARYLYHTIPSQLIPKMSRTSVSFPIPDSPLLPTDGQARRVIYCDSVRVIDKSYSQSPKANSFEVPVAHYAYSRRGAPLRDVFKGESVLAAIQVMLKKCPRAVRIEHEYPDSAADAPWTVRIQHGETITFDLAIHLQLSVGYKDMRAAYAGPLKQVYPGFRNVDETFSLVWTVDEYGLLNADSKAMGEKWREWLETKRSDNVVGLFGFDELWAYLYRDNGDANGRATYMWPDLDWSWVQHVSLRRHDTASDGQCLALLARMPRLRTLYRFNHTGSNVAEHIQDILAQCPDLKQLVLHGGTDGPGDVITRRHHQGLRRLHVHHTSYSRSSKMHTLRFALMMAKFSGPRCHSSIAADSLSCSLDEFDNLVHLCNS